MIKLNPNITGTFRQGGKEYDASLFKVAIGHIEPGVLCPNNHYMTPANMAPVNTAGRQSSPPGTFDAVVCQSEGCHYYGIIYKVKWPSVFLDAVVDDEDHVGAR